jgi:hypothetical protein
MKRLVASSLCWQAPLTPKMLAGMGGGMGGKDGGKGRNSSQNTLQKKATPTLTSPIGGGTPANPERDALIGRQRWSPDTVPVDLYQRGLGKKLLEVCVCRRLAMNSCGCGHVGKLQRRHGCIQIRIRCKPSAERSGFQKIGEGLALDLRRLPLELSA